MISSTEFRGLCGTRSVRVRVSDLVRAVDGDTVLAEIRPHELKLSVFGENNAFIMLSSAVDPRKKISTEDHAILDALAPIAGQQVSAIRTELAAKRAVIFSKPALLIAILAAIAAGVYLIGSIVSLEGIQDRIPYQALKPLGNRVVAEAAPIDPQVRLFQITSGILADLVAHNEELKDIPIELTVSASKQVNAFAAPGAILIMNQGLLAQAQTLDEIYGVMAHELGHIAQRHVLANMARSGGMLFGALLLELVVEGSSQFVLSAAQITGLAFSRQAEAEADDFALRYLRAARVSPKGLEDFFQRAAEKDASTARILSTHPLAEDRLERIRASSAANPYEPRELDRPLMTELQRLARVYD